MRRLTIALACILLSTGSSALFADQIPYANVGTIAPTVALTATSTGPVTGYFYSASAGDTDYVGLLDVNTGIFSGWLFDNQTPGADTPQVFLNVNAGDTLIVGVFNTNLNQIFANDPSYSADGVNHAYITSFSGDKGIPAGIFVGMEDLPNGSSDFDYNDDTFVFTNVSDPPAVPEPGSLALLGTGVLSAAGLIRRRLLTR
jgi:hypothetical protein